MLSGDLAAGSLRDRTAANLYRNPHPQSSEQSNRQLTPFPIGHISFQPYGYV
jgi:hypothetical protein